MSRWEIFRRMSFQDVIGTGLRTHLLKEEVVAIPGVEKEKLVPK